MTLNINPMLTACSIRFYLRPDRKKKEGEHPVWVRVIVNRRKIELFTYHFADPNKWDVQSGRLKGASREDNYLNLKLANIEARVFELRDSQERAGKRFSVIDVRIMLKHGSTVNDMSFIEFFKKHINKLKLHTREYSPTVVVQYQTTMVHFEEYLNSIGQKQLLLRELNTNHLVAFEEYLLTEYINPTLQRGMLRSTANKYLSRIRTVLKHAVRAGAIDRSPFDLGFKLKATKSQREALTIEEIELIARHDLGQNPSLERVRDIFLFSCYTGLRYMDAQCLKAEDIKMDKKNNRLWVKIRQRKTKEIIELPLLSKAVEIYYKYQVLREATGYVLPRLSNQKVNTYLHIIAELVGIKKKVTHHIARHSFASTILLEEDIDIATVSKMLGHNSIRSTAIYARVSRRLLANAAEKVDKKPIIVKPNICLN
ncbi:MAG: tyrosine-type recombinase/integrase [Bacteroidia bacterium]